MSNLDKYTILENLYDEAWEDYRKQNNLTELLVSIKQIENEGNLDTETIELVFSSLKKWTIQLQGGYINE